MRYLDSHAHILSPEFRDDLDDVLQRAEGAGVRRMVIICTQPEEARTAMAFVSREPQRFQAACGLHPEDAGTAGEEQLAAFRELAGDPRISFIGEIGLDYHWGKETRDQQRKVFIEQVELARALDKPVMIHARDAAQETMDILREHRVRGVLHCYSGSAEMAVEYTKMGYYIALGGAVTFRNARHAAEVCAAIDPRYLLSETDCPYMAPEPCRGRRNEPSFIPYIVRKMAMIRGVPEQEMADQIWANGQRFLGVTE